MNFCNYPCLSSALYLLPCTMINQEPYKLTACTSLLPSPASNQSSRYSLPGPTKPASRQAPHAGTAQTPFLPPSDGRQAQPVLRPYQGSGAGHPRASFVVCLYEYRSQWQLFYPPTQGCHRVPGHPGPEGRQGGGGPEGRQGGGGPEGPPGGGL